MLQESLQLIGGCSLTLTLVYLWYCDSGVDIRSRLSKRFTKSVPLQFAEVHNKFGERVPVCGHIRPGEWQCNCKTKPCSVLVRMRAKAVDANHDKLEITDRRGLIAAQKARKRNGS